MTARTAPPAAARPRNIGFVLFDGLTVLDFVGIYDPLTRLRTMGFWPDLQWSVCGRVGHVADPSGLRIGVDHVGKDLSAFDLLVVPGGQP